MTDQPPFQPTGPCEQPAEEFTEQEVRDLLTSVLTRIHDGTLPETSRQRIEDALAARRDRLAGRPADRD